MGLPESAQPDPRSPDRSGGLTIDYRSYFDAEGVLDHAVTDWQLLEEIRTQARAANDEDALAAAIDRQLEVDPAGSEARLILAIMNDGAADDETAADKEDPDPPVSRPRASGTVGRPGKPS